MRAKSVHFAPLIIFSVTLISVSWYWYFSENSKQKDVLSIKPNSRIACVGTAAREENEFKLSLKTKNPSDLVFDKNLEIIQSATYRTLQRHLATKHWQAPQLTGRPYFISKKPMVMFSRDFYFDTPSDLLLSRAVSYRLRHRFGSASKIHNHETSPGEPVYFPYRCEVQAKVDRIELGNGRSKVQESRFEFRIESSPFSKKNPPPPAPWDPYQFIKIAKTGIFNGMQMIPSCSLVDFLDPKETPNSLSLEVKNIVINTRHRMHLNMKTPYGSGPNPDQVFIISIDRSDVFKGKEYLDFLTRSRYQKTVRPRVMGTFLEVEIEFERNVSTILDEKISRTQSVDLKNTRKAFLSDQKHIRKLIEISLKNIGIKVVNASLSKYQQASGIIKSSRSKSLL